MKRSASLDFLRGSAAFAVAIPHYLTTNAPFQPLAEAFAIAGVEVFFVLSGFVLAPQIVDWVVGKPRRNLGVFLARRWMRTIPPYVVALIAVAILTGNLWSRDSLRYLFYVENLFTFANHSDFYPVAWSLAVEEWFYLLFAPILFVVGWLLTRNDRRMEAAFAILFILVVAGLRFRFAPGDWDLNVRRVTMFRIDSIVWGFLLYLAFECWAPRAPAWLAGRRPLGAAVALLAVAIALELWLATGALEGSAAAHEAFPYSSALFGMMLVGVFALADRAFRWRGVREFSFFIGRISYSVYLFHIIIVMALKPKLASWPLAAQLAAYCLVICSFSALFWSGFERPILAGRPQYCPAPPRIPAAIPSPPRESRVSFRPPWASLALGLAVLGAGALARGAFMANRPYVFYALVVATALLTLALADRARPPLRRSAGTAARALLLFALALPLADFAFRTSTGLPLAASAAEPTYSYEAAHENPTAFAMWWFYYLNEWIRDDGIRRSIEMPDPRRKLPFVLIPGASGRMFDTTIRINNLGFRGPDLPRDKGDAFRIFALGEFADLRPDAARRRKAVARIAAGPVRPARLVRPQNRGRQRGNRGLHARGQSGADAPRHPAARARSDPQHARHERAAGARAPASVRDQRAGHPAARLAAHRPRRADHRTRGLRLENAARSAAAGGPETLFRRRAAAQPLCARLSQADRARARQRRWNRAEHVGDGGQRESPREVKDFYGAVFKPIDDIIAANAAHNRLVRLLGRDERVPVIDMAKGVDGLWDDDLYLDIVHFTKRQRSARPSSCSRRCCRSWRAGA